MAVAFESVSPPASPTEIEALRSGLDPVPPVGLVTFLEEHNGARPELNEVDPAVPGADAGIGIEEFLGVNGILDTARRLGSRLRGAIPVATAEGGNLLCVTEDGAVHFWDHELEDSGPLSRVADGLDDFLALLRPFDLENVEFTDEEKSGWVDPELLREMGVEPLE